MNECFLPLTEVCTGYSMMKQSQMVVNDKNMVVNDQTDELCASLTRL